jgi:hypothetical protein
MSNDLPGWEAREHRDGGSAPEADHHRTGRRNPARPSPERVGDGLTVGRDIVSSKDGVPDFYDLDAPFKQLHSLKAFGSENKEEPSH